MYSDINPVFISIFEWKFINTTIMKDCGGGSRIKSLKVDNLKLFYFIIKVMSNPFQSNEFLLL